MRFNTTVARSACEMDRLAPLWTELLQQQRHTIFQSFFWNRLAAEVFPDRLTPYVVTVEAGSGAAIIPAAINHATNRMELLGEALFDYRDVLHAGDPETLRQAWLRVAACGLPLDVVALKFGTARERWGRFPLVPFAGAPCVERDQIAEQQFRAAHPRMGRRLRQLQNQGVRLRRSSGANSTVVRHIYDRKSTQRDTNNLFQDERRREFMVAAASLAGSQCEVFALETREEKMVAGLVTFRDGNIRRFYTTYFEPEWARSSPGMVLLHEVTARSLAEGLSCDYMTGEHPYKLRLAKSLRTLNKVA
ncbi:MAG: GNAT family N-acetyltransferase, partial [Candidatus Korobacteraceae bacterium]